MQGHHRGPGRQDHHGTDQVAEKVVAGQRPSVAEPQRHHEDPEHRRDAEQHRHQLRRGHRQLPAEQHQHTCIHDPRRRVLAHQAAPLPGRQRGNRGKGQHRRQRRQGEEDQRETGNQQQCGDDPRLQHLSRGVTAQELALAIRRAPERPAVRRVARWCARSGARAAGRRRSPYPAPARRNPATGYR